MADDVDVVEKFWPHLAALHRTLAGLPNASAAPAPSTPRIADLVDALAEYAARGGSVPWQ